ncbi:M23 family metallopeptidase [Streptomyces sp. TRM 70351]|uniref:M23 family metallopeptidase n=1 Tax=Streptomyces sp. TRM 70351 TaxID=3116552 RepID=UPI002E7B0A39|nr:M23 family metallopeptidase [Streptomyces sp. TRM 70351]MEE1926649.1 M23 family metallopeptidase [Streptomyces sp. TRM 70351]
MAFTRATGQQNRSARALRMGTVAAAVAVGVAGTFSAPAAAAQPQNSFSEALAANASVAGHVGEQAEALRDAAEAAAQAGEAKKAEAEKKAEAREKAEAEREKADRADRAAARPAFVAPVTGGNVTTGYKSGGAMWSSGKHSGIDFAAATGTPVNSIGAGTIVTAGWGGSYGNNIVVRHTDGTYTQYGHLSAMDVAVGEKVGSGEQIGRVGSTGNSTGPHLHFEARTTPAYGSDMDPMNYLRDKGVPLS